MAAQRASGFPRLADEAYATIEPWPVLALLRCLPDLRIAWDPAVGDGALLATLHRHGIQTVGTKHNFFSIADTPVDDDDLEITSNPPYGPQRRGELAVKFIEHSLKLRVRRVSMLLPVDFDSAISRQHLFRRCPAFSTKVVLLNRIRWIPGSTDSPSTNHCWCIWDHDNVDAPTIRYVSKHEVA